MTDNGGPVRGTLNRLSLGCTRSLRLDGRRPNFGIRPKAQSVLSVIGPNYFCPSQGPMCFADYGPISFCNYADYDPIVTVFQLGIWGKTWTS